MGYNDKRCCRCASVIAGRYNRKNSYVWFAVLVSVGVKRLASSSAHPIMAVMLANLPEDRSSDGAAGRKSPSTTGSQLSPWSCFGLALCVSSCGFKTSCDG